jgi:hypothetical protein
MTWVWVYPSHDHWIVKRTPFSVSVPAPDPLTGMPAFQLLQGRGIPCPTWESVVHVHPYVWATFMGRRYDITDLYVPPRTGP